MPKCPLVRVVHLSQPHDRRTHQFKVVEVGEDIRLESLDEAAHVRKPEADCFVSISGDM